jgi:hypothetical protein
VSDRSYTRDDVDRLRDDERPVVRRLVATVDSLDSALQRERRNGLSLEDKLRRSARTLVVVRGDGSIDVHSPGGSVRFVYVPKVSGVMYENIAEDYAEDALPHDWQDMLSPSPTARGNVSNCVAPERLLLARRVEDMVEVTRSLKALLPDGKATTDAPKARAQAAMVPDSIPFPD